MTALTRWVIRIHKWLELIVGLQVILWIAGGFGMALMPIDQVRGRHLRSPASTYPIVLDELLSPADAADIGEVQWVTGFELVRWHNGPVYVFDTPTGDAAVSATTGERLTPLNEALATEIALAGYAGKGNIASVTYFETPTWAYRRAHPAWQIQFEDDDKTRFYVAANTGQIDAVRTDMWRLFDFFWMLHIMD
jgi:hypothetical protein